MDRWGNIGRLMACILVIDDDYSIRHAIRAVLEREGHDVVANLQPGLATISLIATGQTDSMNPKNKQVDAAKRNVDAIPVEVVRDVPVEIRAVHPRPSRRETRSWSVSITVRTTNILLMPYFMS